jgi:hypothetical protein
MLRSARNRDITAGWRDLRAPRSTAEGRMAGDKASYRAKPFGIYYFILEGND